jgi:para-nitrobenzyl esterase
MVQISLVACGREESPAERDPASQRMTASGEVVGFALEGAHGWRGIPFAKPPVDALRWRPPQPPAPWEGVRETLAYGAVCPQFDRSWKQTGSEDCLLLNVYAPKSEPDAVPRGRERLPVMVWIHGGGQSIGSSHFAVGSRLAAENGVVVVTVQYRLGVLGWLSHPALRADATTPEERSGNWATLDLIRSLEWVRDNVAAFGGDPGRVTIFGQSAGGINVFALLLSPRARGLFHGAISQSGFSTTFSRDQAERYADAGEAGEPPGSRELVLMLLQRDGRADDRTGAKALAEALGPEETASYLRGKSAEELLAVFGEAPGGIGGIYLAPFSIRDGHVLPEDPAEELLARGEYNHVPVVLGTNRDENKAYLSVTSPYVTRAGFVPLRITDPRRYEQVAAYGSRLWKALGADEPARALRRHQRDVWVYRWDWDEVKGPPWIDFSKLLGAAHGTEMPFVFGSPAWSYMPASLFEADSFEPLSRQVRSYWAEFAAGGEPGRGQTGQLPEWTRWSPADGAPRTLLLDTPEGGGVRMSPDTVDRAELVARVAQDPGLRGVGERCEIYQGFVQWSDTFTVAEYEALEDGGCRDHPLPGRTIFD